MTPLEIIKKWFLEQPKEFKELLLFQTRFFKLNEQILHSFDNNLLEKEFIKYIDIPLDKTETLSKTFFLIGLIDFTFSGKETKEDWQDAIDVNLYIGAEFEKDGDKPEFIDKFFANFEERKALWLNSSSSWHYLKETDLKNKALTDWISEEIRKKRNNQ